jgi:hypothetical protein
MTYVAVKGAPSGVLSLFGAARVPVNLAPFGSLLFTSLVVPQASFIGHLAGIVVGYLVAWDAFKWLDTKATSLLLLGTVAVAAGTYRNGSNDSAGFRASLVSERRRASSRRSSRSSGRRRRETSRAPGAGWGANPRPPGCSSPWRALTRDDIRRRRAEKPPNEKAVWDRFLFLRK